VPFDPIRLATTGSPVPILEDVSSTPAGGGDFGFAGAPSGPGTFVYLSRMGSRKAWSISWVDSSGKTQTLLAKPGYYDAPRLSPDGQQLALEVIAGKSQDTYIYDLQRDIMSHVAPDTISSIWAPDGKHLAAAADGRYQSN
jgi:Tol biopolymer transport system component